MRWLRSLLDRSGYSKLGVSSALFAACVLALLIFQIAFQLTSILGFALSSALVAIAGIIELLEQSSNRRLAKLSELCPQVTLAFATGYQSGLSLANSATDLAEYGPERLRSVFRDLADGLDSNLTSFEALMIAKKKISEPNFDRLFEAVIVIEKFGAAGAAAELQNLANQLRNDLKIRHELAAKQSWVTGSAKSALLAPWVVVVMLSARPEAKEFYVSDTGLILLLLGALVSLIAYRYVAITGQLQRSEGIFRC